MPISDFASKSWIEGSQAIKLKILRNAGRMFGGVSGGKDRQGPEASHEGVYIRPRGLLRDLPSEDIGPFLPAKKRQIKLTLVRGSIYTSSHRNATGCVRLQLTRDALVPTNNRR